MKKVILVSFALVVSLVGFAQNKKAAAYNNKLVKTQMNITPKSDKLNETLKTGDATKIKEAEKALISSLDKAITLFKGADAFEGDSKLKEAFADWAVHYKEIVEKDYAEISKILAQKSTPANKEKLKALTADIAKVENEYDLKLEQAQKDFSKAHGLELK